MSVPASRRRESSMEFVHNWRAFCARLNRWAAHLPKRHAFRLVNPMVNHAHEALYHLNAANRTYARDRESFERRRMHLAEAAAEADHVEAMLQVIYEVSLQEAEEREAKGEGNARYPNENAYRQFADAIERQRRLIAGVRRRDAERFGGERQDAGGGPDVQRP